MWHYQGKQFDPDEDFLKTYQGFVYEITELSTGKKYIGKKFFWKPKILPITKTRKRRQRTTVQSDWREYFGSNQELKLLIEHTGVDNYHRNILVLCRNKSECAYWEAKIQFEKDVLLRNEYYNEFIGCKINAKNLKDLQIDRPSDEFKK
jgi:hypothetical protein